VARGSQEEVAIAVHNEGAVVPPEVLAHVFEPGARSEYGTVGDDGHLGLGLFIVDRIVAAHGGSIDVKSTQDDGTVFTVHLPRASQES
jgi:signal transduction histidine kinase